MADRRKQQLEQARMLGDGSAVTRANLGVQRREGDGRLDTHLRRRTRALPRSLRLTRHFLEALPQPEYSLNEKVSSLCFKVRSCGGGQHVAPGLQLLETALREGVFKAGDHQRGRGRLERCWQGWS